MMEVMDNSIDVILDNINDAKDFLERDSIDEFEDVIMEADNIFVVGAGRSGLAAKSFAVRLTHLGLSAYVVGDIITPSIQENDCLVVISGSGETNVSISAAAIAKSRGSRVLALTSYPESSLGELADCSIVVKGRTKQETADESYVERQIHGNYTSLTPLGTAFELSCLMFLDAIIFELMEMMQGGNRVRLFDDVVEAILENIKNSKEFLDEDAIARFKEILLFSRHIFVTGAGRSGLVAKSFAMRLMQLGFSAFVVGETATPHIRKNDCLVVISGSGETKNIVSSAAIAKNEGSNVLALTSYPESGLGEFADCSIMVRGRLMEEPDNDNYLKRQIYGNYAALTPLGTAFELASLVFLDAIVSELMDSVMSVG